MNLFTKHITEINLDRKIDHLRNNHLNTTLTANNNSSVCIWCFSISENILKFVFDVIFNRDSIKSVYPICPQSLIQYLYYQKNWVQLSYTTLKSHRKCCESFSILQKQVTANQLTGFYIMEGRLEKIRRYYQS